VMQRSHDPNRGRSNVVGRIRVRRLDSGMKALFVTRRSLWARFEIGVATTTRVTLAPLSRLATGQKAETFPHVDETKFN
jgi:hypothetical protein